MISLKMILMLLAVYSITGLITPLMLLNVNNIYIMFV